MVSTSSLGSQERAAELWGFLEGHPDACGVVTRRMELVYLNAAARTLAPRRWFGCRCWEVFSPANPACAWRCPVICAAAAAKGICYCEETVFRPDQAPVVLGVAVVPAPARAASGGEVLLLMRPKPAGGTAETIRRRLLDEAERLRAWCSAGLPPPSETGAAA